MIKIRRTDAYCKCAFLMIEGEREGYVYTLAIGASLIPTQGQLTARVVYLSSPKSFFFGGCVSAYTDTHTRAAAAAAAAKAHRERARERELFRARVYRVGVWRLLPHKRTKPALARTNPPRVAVAAAAASYTYSPCWLARRLRGGGISLTTTTTTHRVYTCWRGGLVAAITSQRGWKREERGENSLSLSRRLLLSRAVITLRWCPSSVLTVTVE